MIDAMGSGDFYILCPDNAVTREIDEKRVQWAAEDLIKNRPALSRWHPDYKDAFQRFMTEKHRVGPRNLRGDALRAPFMAFMDLLADPVGVSLDVEVPVQWRAPRQNRAPGWS